MPQPSGITLANEALSLRLLPERGAKLVSLRDRRLEREWLLPSQLPGKGYPASVYGADFSLGDTSGFDECLPNVAAGPAPDSTYYWPDHGELWSRPWEVRAEEETLVCTVRGIGYPYTLTRRLRLQGDALHINYALQNQGAQPFPHLWSAHPLLQVSPGMRILLPDGVNEVFVNGASHSELGTFGELRSWPRLGSTFDFSQVQPKETGVAVKLFVPDLTEGHCTLWEPVTGHALRFDWDPTEIPYLGLWLCYGGWPTDGRAGHLTIAIEPCTGMPDPLHEAWAQGCAASVKPGATLHWSLRLRSFVLLE